MEASRSPAGQTGPPDPAAALAERLFRDMTGALELFTVYLGDRLGLYQALNRDGFDLDADVVVAARRNAEQAGLSGRVTFAVADASGPGLSGRYDLVTVFEGLHDMSRPTDALRAARGMLRKPGWVVIADELVEDEFTAPASSLERYHYGWSVVSCLPAVMGDPGTAATGAVMRPATLRRYAAEAGFRGVDVLPIETANWRFYLLTP